MFRAKLLKCVTYNTTKVYMSSYLENPEFIKKLEHYKHLNAMETAEAKPREWDSAKPFHEIPGPKGLAIIGNLWRFLPGGPYYGKDFMELHKKFYEEFGEIAILKGMIRNPIVMLFNPNDFETLVRNEGVWPIRENLPSLDHYFKHHSDQNLGLVAYHGENWFKIRSVVNPILMQPKNIANYTEKMDFVAQQLVDNMKYFAKQNDKGEMPENFRNELYKWSLESVGVVTLDTHLGCLNRDLDPNSEPQKIIESAIQFFDLMYKLDILPSLWKFYSTRNWRQYVKVLDFLRTTNSRHINAAIEKLDLENIKDEKEAQSVLQQLLQTDRKVAIAMALDMMLAGIDTTGRVMGAGLYFLSKNPEKQSKLREEARNLLPTKNTVITKQILSKAAYLKACIKETTRLAPIGIGNMRTTIKDLVLSGYQIPKGTEVMTSNLILCQMDEYFPKAKEFLPERWVSKDSEISHKSANPFIFAPFGYGPRSCIGKRLANLELEVALLKIIRNFEVSWPHKDMRFATGALYGFADPLKIHVKSVDN